MNDDVTIVDPDTIAPEPFPESGIDHRKLTESLGCTDLRANLVTLSPGQATAPHAHERQEEVYVSYTGGCVRIGEDVHHVPEGGLVRIGPNRTRSVVNDTDGETHTWLMLGAPPTGTVDDFGEYVVPDDSSR